MDGKVGDADLVLTIRKQGGLEGLARLDAQFMPNQTIYSIFVPVLLDGPETIVEGIENSFFYGALKPLTKNFSRTNPNWCQKRVKSYERYICEEERGVVSAKYHIPFNDIATDRNTAIFDEARETLIMKLSQSGLFCDLETGENREELIHMPTETNLKRIAHFPKLFRKRIQTLGLCFSYQRLNGIVESYGAVVQPCEHSFGGSNARTYNSSAKTDEAA
ncbi:MAG: hypothetical protein ACOCXG_03835 [Nanoarchaeota archaeon]